MVLEDQVVDLLLEHAKVTDQAATFKEVMNFRVDAPKRGWGSGIGDSRRWPR